MKKFGPSFLVSLLLHAGLILLALISLQLNPPPVKVASVPVTIISDMPSRQMAEAPVDELAVKTPEPVPAPEEPVPPQPVPEPPQPVPAPVKPAAKPTPAKPAPVPPDKNGMKKADPTPVKKPTPAKPAPKAKPQDSLLDRLAATPSQAPTRRAPSASTQKTTGQSAVGSGPADAGLKTEMNALTQRLNKLWLLNCDVPGSQDVAPEIRFTLSPNGRVTDGPVWVNKRNDPVWQAGANLALAAVNKGQPNAFIDLPDGLYNRPLKIIFDARKACQGR
jgi:outer membrane biosynthesis protein TonB